MSGRRLLPALLLLSLPAACDPFSPRGKTRERMAARTAEAPLVDLRADSVRVYDDEDTTGDLLHDVRYSFEAGGRVREDSLRTLYVPGEQYKVCYDPRDPSNSSIVLADIACGKVF